MLPVLIEQCKRGDQKAQKQLFEMFYGKMMPVCKRYLRNSDDAKDVLNRGFLKVFTNIRKYRYEGPFEAWMRRIFINCALDYLKSEMKIRDTIQLEMASLPDSETDNSIFDKLYLEDLHRIIDQLPSLRRLIFNMQVIDGYTHTEIAEKLQISTGTSKWHVAMARQYLQKRILLKKDDTKAANE